MPSDHIRDESHTRPDDGFDRDVTLTGAFNVRDLGGIPAGPDSVTKRGIIYRADSLDFLTTEDRRILFGKLEVGLIIDLRTPEEAGGDGLSDSRLFPAVRTALHPVIPSGRIGAEPFPVGNPKAVASLYLSYLTERAPIISGAIEAIISSVGDDIPVLFHCAAGRDRTGIIAAALLALAGVDEDLIVDDYLASNLRATEVSHRLKQNPLYRADETRLDNDTSLVDGATMRELLANVRDAYGSFREWALWAGLDEKQLDDLAQSFVIAAD
ncbi:tyrosine-protein phosphatase [Actinoplanes sp. HUAS TT8]|uniref:tyrosine-protein phosphatase n=1 Tax=Actinoplanes sp. HUAS TT8 TaxID=3447453 RepID=UPI003F526F8B